MGSPLGEIGGHPGDVDQVPPRVGLSVVKEPVQHHPPAGGVIPEHLVIRILAQCGLSEELIERVVGRLPSDVVVRVS